jgi:hypothetical protein
MAWLRPVWLRWVRLVQCQVCPRFKMSAMSPVRTTLYPPSPPLEG